MYVVLLLLCMIQGEGQKKPAFDCSSMEKASDYLGLWRNAIRAEAARAQKTGNDLELVELHKRFSDKMDELKGSEVTWIMRFRSATGGVIRLQEAYTFKQSGIRVDAGPIGRSVTLSNDEVQPIEPWMTSLRPGAAVRVTGTVKLIMSYDDAPFVLLHKVRISKLP